MKKGLFIGSVYRGVYGYESLDWVLTSVNGKWVLVHTLHDGEKLFTQHLTTSQIKHDIRYCGLTRIA